MRDIDFYVICAAKNSNKFHKTTFWKKKSVEDVATLGPTAQVTLVFWKSGPASQNRCHAQAFISAMPRSKGIKYHSTLTISTHVRPIIK